MKPDRREASRGHQKRWWVLAAILVIVAGGSFAVGLRSQPRPLLGLVTSRVPLRVPARVPTPSPSPASSAPARAVRPVLGPPSSVLPLARSTPLSLRVPAIGLAVSLSSLGLNPNRTVQVPTNFAQPGWFRLGPSPGQVGSAVILGHVDSYRGPAVFFQLRSLRVGDRVEVSLADGATATFVVNAVAIYQKASFPAREVYGSHGYPGLDLVTCGGQFDTSTRSYLSNVVVYTRLLATTAPKPVG
jgi:hypothetical protein